MKISLMLYPTEPFSLLRAAAQLVEAYRFDGVYTGDIPYGWEYTQVGQLLAEATQSIRVGVLVTNPYTRHPLKTAIAAAGLNHLAQGRFVFGLGAGSRESLQALGLDWHKPVQAIRETIQLLRALQPGHRYTHQGTTFVARDVTIWPSTRGAYPLLIGCRRPLMLRLAGELAEGVILDNVPYAYVAFAKKQIAAGAASKDRDIEGFIYGNITSFSVDNNRREAMDRAKYLVPIDFITISKRELEAAGIPESQIKPIQRALASQTHESHREAAQLVTDEMVQIFSVAGNPEDCVHRLRDAERAGITEIVLCIPMDERSAPMEVIRLTGEHILPAFR